MVLGLADRGPLNRRAASRRSHARTLDVAVLPSGLVSRGADPEVTWWPITRCLAPLTSAPLTSPLTRR